MGCIIKLIPVIIILFSSMAQAQSIGKETLKGIKGMQVVIEMLGDDIEKDGLRLSYIQNDVEVKLRIVGIKVLAEEDIQYEPGMPFLHVKVNSCKNDELESYAFFVIGELKQNVKLERDYSIPCITTTWHSTGVIGTIGAEDVNEIRDYVDDEVEEFIDDYLSVNPK